MSQAFRLILYLIAVHRIFPDRAAELYSYAVTVTAEEPPLFAGEYGRLKTLLLLIELAGRESGGKKSAIGAAGDCGRLQLLYPPARKSHSCTEIQNSKDLDLRLGLSWMIEMRDFCGSVRKGLAAYARGKCGSEEGLKIADFRMAEIEKATP